MWGRVAGVTYQTSGLDLRLRFIAPVSGVTKIAPHTFIRVVDSAAARSSTEQQSYLLIIVTAVVRSSDDPGSLLGVGTDEVDLRVVEDLVVLVRRQFVYVQLHHLFWQHGCTTAGAEGRLFHRCLRAWDFATSR